MLTLIYKRHASFTFSYHLTKILGIRERTYKISEIVKDSNRNAEETMPDEMQQSQQSKLLMEISLDLKEKNQDSMKAFILDMIYTPK